MENYVEIGLLNAMKWQNCYWDLEIDFYSYLDGILSNPNSAYHDQILDAINVKIKENDSNRVKRLLNQIKENSHLEKSTKLDMINGLFCWQLQFSDLNTVEYIIDFVEKNFELHAKTVANYMIKSRLKSTLSFSILSGCVNMVKLMVEKYHCKLNNIYANQMNDLHYCIQNKQLTILEYFLEKHVGLLERKEYSIMLDKQVLSPLDMAIQTNSLECITLILEFYVNNSVNYLEFVHNHHFIKISECVNCVMSKELKDLKVKLLKILFEKCNFSITSKYGVQIKNGLAQTVFSTYCTNENMFLFGYVIDTLKKQTKNQTDLFVVDTILLKFEQSFDMNKKLIEELLKHVSDKRFLNTRLFNYKNGDLLSVKNEHLQNNVTNQQIDWKFMQNSYFQREQMLLNFGLLTEKVCLAHLTDFILHWLNTCSNRSSFISASTTKRYLTATEMIALVESYLYFLIKSGFILLNSKHFNAWRIDLNIRLDQHLEIKSEFDYIIKQACGKHEQHGLFTLKLLCRNAIRQSIRSLSDENLQALDLYPNLSDYLLNKFYI